MIDSDNDGVIETSSQNLGFALESSRHADTLERCLRALVDSSTFSQ